MELLERKIYLEDIRKRLKNYPVTMLLGARQTGKTTLAREIMAEFKERGETVHYFDLELPSDLQSLKEPQHTLEGLKGLIIIDEIQRKEDLFPLLRVLSDRRPLPARFLLLGSASGKLMRQTSESLAGRIAYLELPGFNILEVDKNESEKLWLRGGFPESFLAESNEDSLIWRENFMRTFLERDIPSFGVKVLPADLWRFLQMAAHYHGQTWNSSEIAKSLQISDKTVKNYLDIFTETFIVRQLAPWYGNLSKRVVKSHKFYIRDSGILHALLRINSRDEILRHPKLGASWEGFALEQLIELGRGGYDAYFWNIYNGAEMDLIMHLKGKRWGFEVKYADAPSITKSMHVAKDTLELEHIFVVYPGSRRYYLGERIEAIPLNEACTVLANLTNLSSG